MCDGFCYKQCSCCIADLGNGMPRIYHASAASGVEHLPVGPPATAGHAEAGAPPLVVGAPAGLRHQGAPRSDFAPQISPAELSLLGLLSPTPDFTLPAGTDWPAVTGLAVGLDCLPRLAALHLAALERAPNVAEKILETWWEARRQTAAHNLLLAHEERVLLGEFSTAGLQAVPLKGVSLARILRGDPASRAVIDIDLAVPPAHAARAADLLGARGYRVSLPAELLRRGDFLGSAGEKNAEITATRQLAGSELLVELHWKLLPLPEAEVWAAAHHYQAADVRTLAPDLYFLFLCEHLAGHGWAGLRWLCDVADFLLLFADEMNAARILRLIRTAGLRRRVGITLELLDAYFGLSWPALDSLGGAATRRHAARFLTRPLNRASSQTPAAHHREQLALRDNAGARLKYAAALLRPTHVEWLCRSENGDTQVRRAAAAWAYRMARLAGLSTGAAGRP